VNDDLTNTQSMITKNIAVLLVLMAGCFACTSMEKTDSTTQRTDSVATVIYEQVAAESAAVMDQLQKAAEEINRQCPVQVDTGTRLDSAQAMSATELQYFYTLTATDRATANFDVAQLEVRTKPMLIESVRTNQAMADLREHSVTLIYTYRDRVGTPVMRIPVGPAEYGRQ
jgi:hypothetical protein